jgi:hypothetical protein
LLANQKQIYYRLIALWAVCEGVLGGIIHGFNLPISGLIIGGSAVILISLIAYYVPSKGSIIKATILVAIFKMMLSPHSPLPAYFAVFFQGIAGELIFFLLNATSPSRNKYFKVLCIVFAAIALVESGVQRIITMTIIYGIDFWKAVNDFISNLAGQQSVTNYSLYITAGYVALHLVAGIFIGWLSGNIPINIKQWRTDDQFKFLLQHETLTSVNHIRNARSGKKSRWKTGLRIVWIILLILFIQSEFKIGAPLLSSDEVLHILIRSFIILLTWYFLVSPLMLLLMKKWLAKQQSKSQSTINEILLLIPSTKLLLEKSWEYSSDKKGFRRLNKFLKIVLTNSLIELARLESP